LLKAALDELWVKRQDFKLNVFFTSAELSPYMTAHERYTYSDLERIFGETDVLVAPSVWHETFGYTVLEALSFGVPVIVSGNVGAKDIIPADGGIVLENISVQSLENEINKLSAERLRDMNLAIVNGAKIKTLSDMVAEIMRECY